MSVAGARAGGAAAGSEAGSAGGARAGSANRGSGGRNFYPGLGGLAGLGTGGVNDDAAGAGGTPDEAEQPVIDDFDDGDAVILPFEARSGGWYTFNDTTGVQNSFTVATVSGNTTPAVHLLGTGFKSWGAGIGVNLKEVSGQREPYDVSRFRGIAFRAKIAAGTQSSARLLVITKYSAPQYGLCGGEPGRACGDHLACVISPLKTTWTKHQCLFADLTQDGSGLPQAALEAASVLGIQIRFGTENPSIDAWLDDVSFVPATP